MLERVDASANDTPRSGPLLLIVRWGIPAVLTVAAILILLVDEGSRRWDGFAMCLGAALSLLFLTTVFTMGAKGDLERDDEEAAREYLRVHGRWPDEAPKPDR